MEYSLLCIQSLKSSSMTIRDTATACGSQAFQHELVSTGTNIDSYLLNGKRQCMLVLHIH